MTRPARAAAEPIIDAVLARSGATDPALRRAVLERAASYGGAPATTESLPPELVPFVEKVARWAYRTTDEDVAALRAAGWSEDAIFEFTVSAALGAGIARLERGLAALDGR